MSDKRVFYERIYYGDQHDEYDYEPTDGVLQTREEWLATIDYEAADRELMQQLRTGPHDARAIVDAALGDDDE